jgi:hypothetical protein
MLEYYKIVLGNVTFDPALFRKELRKAFRNLVDNERAALSEWLRRN